MIPNHCGSCRYGDAQGIVSTQVVCAHDRIVRDNADACDLAAWAVERRSFTRLFPDYPYAIQDSTGRLLKQRLEAAMRGEAELEPVQDGLVQIRGKHA